ncbi:tyrosine-type recombinase/integrase [Escherichia coli]|uniref:tyrosine-type recombinase/integrase n=1 Tax=Escherichia coli TaxID=562 RepID=UPI000E0B0E85|nr:tyrosine-type recombinase/integrase [Escherichia coli]AXH21387.1 phage integrase family protein [Escherichia coli]
MNTFPLQISQNSRSDAIGTYAYFDYADALALREMASQADLPKYLLAPEVSVFLRYVPLTGASFQLDGSRPFVRLKTLKQRQRGRGRPGKDEEVFRLVPLTDPQYVRKVREFLTTLRIGKQQLLWPVQSDNTPRNWIRKALDLAKRDSVTFSIPVTCHTFRHSFCMHLIQHGVPLKVVQAYAGHSRLETTETYTRVFALDVGRQYGVRFSLPDSHLTLPE